MSAASYAETIGMIKATLELLRDEFKERAELDREREQRMHQEAVIRAELDAQVANRLHALTEDLGEVQKRLARLEGYDDGPVLALAPAAKKGVVAFIVAVVTALAAALGFGGGK